MREYFALLAGTPLGGLLYSLGRLVPFAFDAVSYFVSVVSLLFVRAQLQGGRVRARRRLLAEVREGLAWFWRQPFVRTTSLLVMGSDLTLNALFLVVIVLDRPSLSDAALRLGSARRCRRPGRVVGESDPDRFLASLGQAQAGHRSRVRPSADRRART